MTFLKYQLAYIIIDNVYKKRVPFKVPLQIIYLFICRNPIFDRQIFSRYLLLIKCCELYLLV